MAANKMISTIYRFAKRNPKYKDIKMSKSFLIINGKYYNTNMLELLPSDIHPSKVSQLETDNFIAFGTPLSRYNFLSNFYQTRIKYNKKNFNCAEQLYQYMKCVYFGDQETANKIFKTSNPAVMKLLGKQVTNFSHSKWDKVKDKFMYKIVFDKFAQNATLRKKLLATGQKSILECKSDRHYGTGITLDRILYADKRSYGANILGKILQDVRHTFNTTNEQNEQK